jgi:hypothetical protein
MANNINNPLLNSNKQNRPAQVFDIALNTDLINSLQESINSLANQLGPNPLTNNNEQETNNSNSDTNVFVSDPTITPRNSETRNSARPPANSDQVTTIRGKDTYKYDRDGLSKRTYKPGADLTVSDPDINPFASPKIQVPLFERSPIGSEILLSDGTIIQTSKNSSGATVETVISPNGSTITKTYEDYQPDKKGNPTGFRTTIVDNNYNVTILSTIINDLGDGIFSTITTNITDPSNPFNVSSSALRKNPAVFDDDGNNLYNSNTTRSDGYQESAIHESLSFEDSDALRRPTGYRTTYTSFSNGETQVSKTETISYTDDNGKRITKIFDITDSNNIFEISTITRDDPFTLKKTSGTQLSNMLDKVNQWGLLDITGDEKLDPSSDLLLISRYLKGFRGSQLTENINLGENPKSITEIEQKIATALNRGLFDIVGTTSNTDNNDLKILARYMMGARGEILLDKKSAMDDKIKINPDGTNVLSIDEMSPILGEVQEIFGVDGKKLEITNANGQKQNYKLFFVDTVNPS